MPDWHYLDARLALANKKDESMHLNIPAELYQVLVEEANKQHLPVKTYIMRLLKSHAKELISLE